MSSVPAKPVVFEEPAAQSWTIKGELVSTVPVDLGRFKKFVGIIARSIRLGQMAGITQKEQGHAVTDASLLWLALENMDEFDIAALIACCVDKDEIWIGKNFRMGWGLAALTHAFFTEGLDLVTVLRNAQGFAGQLTTPAGSPTSSSAPTTGTKEPSSA